MEKEKKDYPIWKMILMTFLTVAIVYAILAAILIIAGWFIFGSEERKHEQMKPQVRKLAVAYIEEQYPGNDFEITDLYHNFKDNSFDVKVQSRSSTDTHFTIRYSDNTLEVDYDSYEWSVANRGNTAQRIVDDYTDRTKAVLKALPGMLYVQADFVRYSETASHNLHFSPDGLVGSTLELDRVYDAGKMGWDFGCLSVKFQEVPENVNIQRLLERLWEVDEAMTQAGVGYQVIGITLEPKPDGQDVGALTVYAIRREDLYSDDPIAVLQALWEEQEANRQALKEQWAQSDQK